MRYAAYLCTPDGTYRDLETVIEADSLRDAAQRAIELAGVHPDDEFPQLLIVPDDQVETFTRDDDGRAVKWDDDLPRQLRKGPETGIMYFEPWELRLDDRRS